MPNSCPFQDRVVAPATGRIWMLMAGAALVLAIVCVNLAGLMLGRNTRAPSRSRSGSPSAPAVGRCFVSSPSKG